jgi:outer membrane protein assembly factor BamE (lipoprotein component of BamABCDE complex)
MNAARAPQRPRLALAGVAACLAAACVAGCALPAGTLVIDKPESSLLAGGLTAAAAQQAVTVGQSTKAQVAAALGAATVVKFDSGYEVWVYRGPEVAEARREPDEFVILFSPAGVATRTRVRPGAPLEARNGR